MQSRRLGAMPPSSPATDVSPRSCVRSSERHIGPPLLRKALLIAGFFFAVLFPLARGYQAGTNFDLRVFGPDVCSRARPGNPCKAGTFAPSAGSARVLSGYRSLPGTG